MRKKIYLAFALVALLFSSCATPNVSYFSDMSDNQSIDMMQDLDIRLRPEDKISIVVKSMDPKLSDLFNLPIIAHRVGYSQESTLNNAQQVSVYTIDSKGDIDFPVLGKIKVAGSKREHVAQVIKDQLVDRNLVKDPVVTVEYANLCFNVLGEVNKPGRYTCQPAQWPRTPQLSRLLPAAERRSLCGAQRLPCPSDSGQRQQRPRRSLLDLRRLPPHLRCSTYR